MRKLIVCTCFRHRINAETYKGGNQTYQAESFARLLLKTLFLGLTKMFAKGGVFENVSQVCTTVLKTTFFFMRAAFSFAAAFLFLATSATLRGQKTLIDRELGHNSNI